MNQQKKSVNYLNGLVMSETSFFLKTISIVFINGNLRKGCEGLGSFAQPCILAGQKTGATRSPEQPGPEGAPKK